MNMSILPHTPKLYNLSISHHNSIRMLASADSELLALRYLRDRKIKWARQRAPGFLAACKMHVAEYPKPVVLGLIRGRRAALGTIVTGHDIERRCLWVSGDPCNI